VQNVVAPTAGKRIFAISGESHSVLTRAEKFRKALLPLGVPPKATQLNKLFRCNELQTEKNREWFAKGLLSGSFFKSRNFRRQSS